MGLNSESSAALVFLILYAILFAVVIAGYATRRFKLKSRYSVILFHVTVRLASQSTGLAFGIKGYEAINLLIAYFILGAEGYFTLVLCTFRFLISWHNHNLNAHDSWLEPRRAPGIPFWQRFLQSFALVGSARRPMSVIHTILIGANTIIITGGSILAGSTQNLESNKNLGTAKALRAAGQSMFLAINIFLLFCILKTITQSKRERQGAVHPTLILLLVAWPLLTVRGIYGILSAVLDKFNYYNFDNYDANGLTVDFVASEYVLGTAMEWASCLVLMATYVTSRNDPKKADIEAMQVQIAGDKGEQ